MKTETLPYLYFVPSGARTLILGSFPCFNGKDYGDWFYSGSGKNYFWMIMSDIFEMPASNRKEKELLCERNKIALTDVAFRIRRTKGNCSDSNLEIIEYNHKGLEVCLNSRPERIFFTSRFVQKHFNLLFPGNKIPTTILLSPSPAANRHIGGLSDYKKLVKDKKIVSPFDYRLMMYRQWFREQVRKPSQI